MTKTPVENLISSMTALNTRPKHTINQYRSLSNRFLSSHGPNAPQSSILDFISTFNAPATKEFVWLAVKHLYQANDWKWPFAPGIRPKVTDTQKIRLPTATIQAIIEASMTLEPEKTAIVALSTVYGFRRDELCRMTKRCLEHDTIIVKTAKSGVIRTHRLPDELLPYVTYDVLRDRSVSWVAMSKLFQNIVHDAGIVVPVGAGWHSIRRSLVTELANPGTSVREMDIVKFMGWKAGAVRILYTYANPDQHEIDSVIFKAHPYLPFWR